jgi:predicted enzyme related to lactoylglutathione lyase
MALRAFPVLYAGDVEAVAAFYAELGELFVYVDDVDATVEKIRRATEVTVLREPADMPWGERLAFVGDPEGNVVALAMPAR